MEIVDYYKILELDHNATDEQIWLAYHKLVFLHRIGKLNEQKEKINDAQEAYQILIHPLARARYDQIYNSAHKSGIEKIPYRWRRNAAIFLTSFLSTIIIFSLHPFSINKQRNLNVKAFLTVMAVTLGFLLYYIYKTYDKRQPTNSSVRRRLPTPEPFGLGAGHGFFQKQPPRFN